MAERWRAYRAYAALCLRNDQGNRVICLMYYTRFHTLFCEMILVGNEEGLTHLHLNTGEGKRLFAVADEWVSNDAFFRAPWIRSPITAAENGKHSM